MTTNEPRKRYADTCEDGRIHDGNGYDRGECILCKGKGCPEESNYIPMTTDPKPVTRGQVFRRLTVLSLVEHRDGGVWLCRCECGNETLVSSKKLRTGNTKSCGCLKRDAAAVVNRQHGYARRNGKTTTTYQSWCNMTQRCTNPNSSYYREYGARGISICERWQDFNNFLADLGECPEGYSLERKNVNGNYEPDNCCWIPLGRQSRNTRRNVYIEAFGIKACVADWADALAVGTKALLYRFHQGWDHERIVSEPIRSPHRCA